MYKEYMMVYANYIEYKECMADYRVYWVYGVQNINEFTINFGSSSQSNWTCLSS